MRSICTWSSDIGLVQLWLNKVGMTLITMGGDAFSIPFLHFLTDAIIQNVRGTLVRVKY